jgi:hypothetical protein
MWGAALERGKENGTGEKNLASGRRSQFLKGARRGGCPGGTTPRGPVRRGHGGSGPCGQRRHHTPHGCVEHSVNRGGGGARSMRARLLTSEAGSRRGPVAAAERGRGVVCATAARCRALTGRTGLAVGVGDGEAAGCVGRAWADPARCEVGRAQVNSSIYDLFKLVSNKFKLI